MHRRDPTKGLWGHVQCTKANLTRYQCQRPKQTCFGHFNTDRLNTGAGLTGLERRGTLCADGVSQAPKRGGCAVAP
jgi:hypothetical protein